MMGKLTYLLEKKMAHKIYKDISGYDKIISDWLDDN